MNKAIIHFFETKRVRLRKRIFGKRKLRVTVLALLVLPALAGGAYTLSYTLFTAYKNEISARILDRNGALISESPNAKGEFMTPGRASRRLRELAVLSEDRYFYYHPGVNPVSFVRSAYYNLFTSRRVGGSTVTQQLVKNLLHHENQRTIQNKLTELIYALALELITPKHIILSMYLDTAYFGGRIEGVEEASLNYFGKNSESLTDGEIIQLLALLSSPGKLPGTDANQKLATSLGERLGGIIPTPFKKVPSEVKEARKDDALFEVAGLADCTSCTLTIDRELTEKIRDLVRQNLSSPKFASVGNAAIAVIRVGKRGEPNQLLALVGSPNPYGGEEGSQINMALSPRPIGSTWKPFIYSLAIEKGARPYTLIDDAEYRYEIGTGFALYPKNYDGIYRGLVTLNYALSNSLNVPAVRALGFDGVDQFGEFMEGKLGFIPRQSFDTYQLSIALGGLEMNPLLLAEYFTVFPRNGVLAPLAVETGGKPTELPMMKQFSREVKIFNSTTSQLMNRMLSDRLMGVEQFGLESNLNLPFEDYAVKTGTTYDYHDSWTVGFTSDIVVVAWIGNSNNKAMDQLSGARGAGKLWHDTMALLYDRGDIHPLPFKRDALVPVSVKEGESFGLEGDDINLARGILTTNDIILEPHDGDVLLYQEGMSVPLRSRRALAWSVNGEPLGTGEELFWAPTKRGVYMLRASSPTTKAEVLKIEVK